jgi:hypothetical protein
MGRLRAESAVAARANCVERLDHPQPYWATNAAIYSIEGFSGVAIHVVDLPY